MNKKEIRKEIKELEIKLKEVHTPTIVSNVEEMRAREEEVFEADGVEFGDEKMKEVRVSK